MEQKNKKQKTAQDLYDGLVIIAENICAEIKWAYVNYEILDACNQKKITDKFTNTYSGNVWAVLRRSLLNETLLALSKVIIDKKNKPSSFHALHELLKKEEVIELVKLNYTQAEDAFDDRLQDLLEGLSSLDEFLKNHDAFKSLAAHRNNYLVHRSQKVSKSVRNFQWGDEKTLISIVADIMHPMELMILNGGNISNSTRSVYRAYAKNFWDSIEPDDARFKYTD